MLLCGKLDVLSKCVKMIGDCRKYPLITVWCDDYSIVESLVKASENIAKERELSFKYQLGEDWVQGLVDAIRVAKQKEFEKSFCGPDIYFISDLECLYKKSATQQELCYMIRSRIDNGKQTVICSPDRSKEFSEELLAFLESECELRCEKDGEES